MYVLLLKIDFFNLIHVLGTNLYKWETHIYSNEQYQFFRGSVAAKVQESNMAFINAITEGNLLIIHL